MLFFYQKQFHFRKLHSINNAVIINTEKIREEKKRIQTSKYMGKKLAKYFGINLYEHLPWKSQTEQLGKRLSRSCGLLSNLRYQ